MTPAERLADVVAKVIAAEVPRDQQCAAEPYPCGEPCGCRDQRTDAARAVLAALQAAGVVLVPVEATEGTP